MQTYHFLGIHSFVPYFEHDFLGINAIMTMLWHKCNMTVTSDLRGQQVESSTMRGKLHRR